jgi:undecaprenyl diphosphate synthase
MSQLPKHIAIIMDGNGRWAKKRGLSRSLGHRKGLEALRSTVENSAQLGIEYLTVFGFSTENWKRSSDEISELMGLLRFYLKNELQVLHSKGAKLRVIGDRDRLAGDIIKLIENAEKITASNDRINATIALSYGARSEIVAASQELARKVALGELKPEDINEKLFDSCLMTSELPPLDLLIRTSGELRISNFLLWQAAYSEMVFTDTLWPDFDKNCLTQALDDYSNRQRRFGAEDVVGAAQ